MHRITHRKKCLLLLLLSVLLLVGCGKKETEPEPLPAAPVLPDALVSLRSNVTLLTENEADALSGGTFTVSYRNLIHSGQGQSYKDYTFLKATLEQIRLRYDAYQVYLLSDLDDDLTALEVTIASNTAGTADPCPWEEHHKAEYALTKAYNGTAASDMFARQWDDTILTWTAYAPIRDASGNVIAVLAIESVSPLLEAYPEWNRMSTVWNGIIDPIE